MLQTVNLEFKHGAPLRKAQRILQALDTCWSALQRRQYWNEAEQVIAVKCIRCYDPVTSRWLYRLDRIQALADDQRLTLARRQALQHMRNTAENNPQLQKMILTDRIN